MSAIFSLEIGLRSGQRPVSGFGPGEGIPNIDSCQLIPSYR